MIYLGEWIAADFHEQAPDGDGRQLFLSMTDFDLIHIWPEDQVTPDWDAAYHAFQCRHCDRFLGYWDST